MLGPLMKGRVRYRWQRGLRPHHREMLSCQSRGDYTRQGPRPEDRGEEGVRVSALGLWPTPLLGAENNTEIRAESYCLDDEVG